MKTSDVIKYVVSVALAAVLLYFSFRGVNWTDFLDGLRACSWGWIAVAMGAGVMSFWLRGLRWRELLIPIDPSTRRLVSFNAINIGLLANLIFPRIGEFVRCGFITRHSAVIQDNANPSGKSHLASYDKVLGTVITERSLDVLTLLSLVAILFFSMREKVGNFLTDKIINPLFGRIDMGLTWILALTIITGIGILSVWLVRKFRDRNRIAAAVCRLASGMWGGLVSLFKIRRWWLFVIYTILIWTMYWLMSMSVLLAVQGMDMSMLSADFSGAVEKLAGLGASDALFLMIVGSLSSLVPVPGGFGAFHYIVATALTSVYGVPFGVGIMFATLSHESQTITQILCGGLSYASEVMAKE